MLQEGRAKLAQEFALMANVGDESGTQAPRVGRELRLARDRLGYKLDVVADALRIRAAYLCALEEGHIEDLPGSVYAMAFLRSYALALGLDPEEISRRFKLEADEIDHRTELEFPTPVPSRAIPGGALMLLGLVLAVGAYTGWYQLSGQGRLPAEAVAPVPARLASLAEQALPPPGPQARDTAPGSTGSSATRPDTGSPGVSVPVYTPGPYTPTQAAAMPLPTPPVQLAVVAPPPTPVVVPENRIVIRAKGEVWIRVRDRAGPVLFDRVLHAGDSYTMPTRAGLLVSTGNALATEFLVDGEVTPGLGGAKGVRRDLVVEAETLKDGRFATQHAIAGNGAVTRTP